MTVTYYLFLVKDSQLWTRYIEDNLKTVYCIVGVEDCVLLIWTGHYWEDIWTMTGRAINHYSRKMTSGRAGSSSGRSLFWLTLLQPSQTGEWYYYPGHWTSQVLLNIVLNINDRLLLCVCNWRKEYDVWRTMFIVTTAIRIAMNGETFWWRWPTLFASQRAGSRSWPPMIPRATDIDEWWLTTILQTLPSVTW